MIFIELGDELAAFAPSAVGAMFASATVNHTLLTAIGTYFIGSGAIFNVTAQRAGYTIFPSCNGVDIEIEF